MIVIVNHSVDSSHGHETSIATNDYYYNTSIIITKDYLVSRGLTQNICNKLCWCKFLYHSAVLLPDNLELVKSRQNSQSIN